MRALVFFLILAISAGAAFVTWRFVDKPEKQVETKVIVEPKIIEKEIPTVEVVVAARDIPIGATISADMVNSRAWPSNLINSADSFVLREALDIEVIGRVARTTVREGEPVLKNFLANPSDPSFLAAALKEGMRAITIQIDAISGVAGFVYPGDVVDVLVTRDVEVGGPIVSETGDIIAPKAEPITEVIAPSVRVMAVDQRFIARNGEPPAPAASVTLEVSPLDAQRLRLAESKGRLSLVLKSLKQPGADEANAAADIPRPVGVGDLSRVTPPSLFPAIYEGGDKVKPKPVDVSGFGAEGTVEGASANAGVTVVRGVQKQIEGAGKGK